MAPTDQTPVERLYAIVEQGLCIGCGICQAIAGPETISVTKTASGYEHPVVIGQLDHATVDTVYDVCPGTRIEGLPERSLESDTAIDPVWGPWRRIVRAWASDPVVRFEGSTGGALTAIGQYLLDSGRVAFVLHVKASTSEPTFGETTLSFTADQVLGAGGSRYGPTAALINIDEVLDRGERFAVIAKPCDLAALRNLANSDRRVDELVGYWLTLVCGGFGPPEFTNDFLERNGIDRSEVTRFRYRGRGCPGPTRVETVDRVEEYHYLDYWGDDESQWSLPWRCKICPDGIGEVADLAAADTWHGGSPTREGSDDDPGTNAIIARTVVGEELLAAAVAAGAITVERDIGVDDMTRYQPHQVAKKLAVAARIAGIADEGRIVPLVRRLRVDELADSQPVAIYEAQRAGTRRRIEDGKATLPTPDAPGER